MTLKLDLTDTSEIHNLYPKLRGELAFDIGANGGQVANILAEHFGTVIACEPSAEPFQHLVTNGAPNVRPLYIAISDESGDIQLEEREMSKMTGYLFTGNTLPEWGEVVEHHVVPARTLDDLTTELGQPDFVKIDTEGHEVHVLRGGEQTFRSHPMFIVEIHSAENGLACTQMLDEWGCSHRLIRHEQHEPEGLRWKNHYWLVGT